MSNGQDYYGGGGGYGAPQQGNPYAQPGPYAQPQPQQQAYGQPNPYSQPAPPQDPYGQPAPPQHPYAPQQQPPQHPYGAQQPQHPYAQPAPPQPAPAAVPAQPAGSQEPGYVPDFARMDGGRGGGSAPRRSRIGVLLQFTLQWIYLPLWIGALVALVVLAMFAGGGGPSGPKSDAWLKPHRFYMPYGRLKAELSGRPEDWEAYVAPVLARRIREAEARHAAGEGALQPDLSRKITIKLALRYFRGLGADGLARLAARHGWELARDATTAGHAVLERVIPAPVLPYVPGPNDPPAAPGTPWGPLPTRFALLLPFVLVLQLVYVPVWGLLTFWVKRSDPSYWGLWFARWTVGPRVIWAEMTGSTAAWENHVRRIMARDIAKRGAPTAAYVPRFKVDVATYKGIGGHHLLRLAAEQGWYLDPAFTPRPEVAVHLFLPSGAANPQA
ncbi:hypothetical protein ACWEQL_32240 [Kitasatospora sp. NPDC004240]